MKTTRLEAPEQGLDEATLDATDVLVWWSHKKNPAVSDERAEFHAALSKLLGTKWPVAE